MRIALCFVFVGFALGAGGCGGGSDDATLRIAESFEIADLEVSSAERTDRFAIAGTPDSAWPSYASVTQIYVPVDDKQAVYDELRAAAVADGWVIAEDHAEGSWVSAEREVDGRFFTAATGFIPSEDIVSLHIDETDRRIPR